MLQRPMCTDRDVKEALALHKPCRQIRVPFQVEKEYSPGVLIYNWAEDRHKVRTGTDQGSAVFCRKYRCRYIDVVVVVFDVSTGLEDFLFVLCSVCFMSSNKRIRKYYWRGA